MNKFNKGDKVKILGKNTGSSLECSIIYKRCKKQGYGYVTGYVSNVRVSDTKGGCGDFFLEGDLEHYGFEPYLIDEGLFVI